MSWLETDAAANIVTTLVVIAAFALIFYLWRSPVWGLGLRRLRKRRLAMVCLGVLSLYAFSGRTTRVPISW